MCNLIFIYFLRDFVFNVCENNFRLYTNLFYFFFSYLYSYKFYKIIVYNYSLIYILNILNKIWHKIKKE